MLLLQDHHLPSGCCSYPDRTPELQTTLLPATPTPILPLVYYDSTPSPERQQDADQPTSGPFPHAPPLGSASQPPEHHRASGLFCSSLPDLFPGQALQAYPGPEAPQTAPSTASAPNNLPLGPCPYAMQQPTPANTKLAQPAETQISGCVRWAQPAVSAAVSMCMQQPQTVRQGLKRLRQSISPRPAQASHSKPEPPYEATSQRNMLQHLRTRRKTEAGPYDPRGAKEGSEPSLQAAPTSQAVRPQEGSQTSPHATPTSPPLRGWKQKQPVQTEPPQQAPGDDDGSEAQPQSHNISMHIADCDTIQVQPFFRNNLSQCSTPLNMTWPAKLHTLFAASPCVVQCKCKLHAYCAVRILSCCMRLITMVPTLPVAML